MSAGQDPRAGTDSGALAGRPTFGAELQDAVARRGPLVVGVDPHAALLSAWNLGDDAAGVREFSLRVLEATAEHACALKPQSAFFERHGSAGIAVLEELLGAARERGILTILDAKRGDIGSTMGGYAQAYLRPGAPLEADALTVSPYLGFGSLEPALELSREHGKGLFVLALTSNPEGAQVQHASDAGGGSVALRIAEGAAEANAHAEPGRWGSVGLVVGATTGGAAQRLGIDLAAVRGPLLAPGFGAQGAGPGDVPRVFGEAADRVLVSISRQVLEAGPDADALSRTAAELARQYRAPSSTQG